MADNIEHAKSENERIISDVMSWLETQIDKHQFCDVSISFSNHGGKIAKVQKSLTEKFNS